ncbi:MAG: DUF368 domain-containing protein [Myxococcota bacterium]
MTAWFATTLRGVCMGIADIIPGVSGGTLALILGIYERFVGAVSAIGPGMLMAVFSREFWRRFAAGLRSPGAQGDDAVGRYAGHVLFLSFLAVGILFAFAVGAKVIPRMLDLYPAPMKGFFFGLVLASIRIPFRMMKQRGAPHIAMAIAAAIGTWFFVGLPLDSSERASGDVVVTLSAPAAEGTTLSREGLVLMTSLHGGENEKHEVVFGPTHDIPVPAGATEITVPVVARMAGTTANVQSGAIQVIHRGPAGASVSQPLPMKGGIDPSLIWIFIAGCIAISAMVLPGISGSFVLLMFGLYHYMTFTLRSLLYDRDPAAVTVVLVFVSALIVGIAGFSRILSWLLRHQHDLTMAALIGLMAGSLRKIWPFVATGVDGIEHNVLPTGLGGMTAVTLATFVAGALLVLTLDRVGALRAPKDGEGAAA